MPAKKTPVNIPGSVKEKLMNVARKADLDFQGIFKRYVQERLLYRLAQSSYRENFILKGALLIHIIDPDIFRPTKDIDLLGMKILNEPTVIETAFREIAAFESNDGLDFDVSTIHSEFITKEGGYQGLRIHFGVRLGTARDTVQIDIGFGDIVYKGPVKIEYPTLLHYPAPVVSAYSIESAVAEKFEAICSLGLATSRMKDFYDLLLFAQKKSFSSTDLRGAIESTFKHRGTSLPHTAANPLFTDFYNDSSKEKQWKAFLLKNRFDPDISFLQTLGKIESFLLPMLNDTAKQTWLPALWKWE